MAEFMALGVENQNLRFWRTASQGSRLMSQGVYLSYGTMAFWILSIQGVNSVAVEESSTVSWKTPGIGREEGGHLLE